MIIIGVESSAVAASAAVLKDGVIVSECYLNAGLTHSQTLMTLIDGALRNADITVKDADSFAVAHGPGSFTGVRIGVSAVKGLCFPYDTPCYGVSTLEAMAFCADAEDCIICPVMDARCQQVYTALFRKEAGEIKRITEDEALQLEELAQRMNAFEGPIVLIGDGTAPAYAYLSQKSDRIRKFSEIYRFQRASGVAMAAWSMYNKGIEPCGGAELQPVYLRPSQAERELKKKNAEKEEKES